MIGCQATSTGCAGRSEEEEEEEEEEEDELDGAGEGEVDGEEDEAVGCEVDAEDTLSLDTWVDQIVEDGHGWGCLCSGHGGEGRGETRDEGNGCRAGGVSSRAEEEVGRAEAMDSTPHGQSTIERL